MGVAFCPFWVSWVLLYSVRETLLGWHKSFVDRKHRKVWRAGSLCLFQIVWKARNRIAFEGEELSIQSLKSELFICCLWSEAKGRIDDVPLTLFRFLDWLGPWWGWAGLVPFYFVTWFIVVFVGGSCIRFVYHGLLFWRPFLMYFSFCL